MHQNDLAERADRAHETLQLYTPTVPLLLRSGSE